MPTILDHVLAFTLIVALPAYAAFEYRRLTRTRIAMRERGLPCDNVPEYRWTIALQGALTVAMLVSWFVQSRGLPDLGVVTPPARALWSGWGFAVAAAIAVAIVILLTMQARTVRHSEAMRAAVRGQLEPVRELLPSTPRELRWFSALSLTAGMCEELLYRGWMLWYLSQAMSLWAAVPLQALIFGVAHAYQGMSGLAKTTPVGLVAAALYVVGGSLWAPMLLHAAIDLFSGRMAFDAITRREQTSASAPAASAASPTGGPVST